MLSVNHGAQRASRAPRSSSVASAALPAGRLGSPSRAFHRAALVAALVASLLATGLAAVTGPAPVDAATRYILMPRSELLAKPTSGTAWTRLRTIAAEPLGTPDLCNQDSKHHLRTLAAALVFARTGAATYGQRARIGVMSAIRTQRVGCHNAVLALGRQLPAYVLAADFAGLSTANRATFRSWLSTIRTKWIGGHSIWTSLRRTHNISAANWGAYAGAARIAADLYLGDRTDLAAAARVTRGFLGDRTAYRSFTYNYDATDLSWSCSGRASTATPTNGTCTRSGINVDGAFIADISRGGPLSQPPGDTGVQYQLETLQGMGLQVELLYRNGYSGAWGWSNRALKRAAGVVTRSAAAGGTGWNETTASRQMPWLLNRRYGLRLPTAASGMGRAIGFTDWLYGR